MFDSRRLFDLFVLERALIQAIEMIHLEFADLITRTSNFWDLCFAHWAIRRLFISRKPPFPIFFKVNFDSNIISNGWVDFVNRYPDLRLVAMGGSRLFGLSVLEVKLWIAWTGIVYARLTLWTDRLMIEGDYSTVIGWIQSYTKGTSTHPLL